MPETTEHHPVYCTSDYLWRYLKNDEYKERIKLARRALKPWLPHFDAIAFRGMSGTIIGPPVALALDKTMILVRNSEKSHSEHKVEGDSGARRYIILDDFIVSGSTMRAIKRAVKKFSPKAECLGTLCVSRLNTESIREQEREYRRVCLVDHNDQQITHDHHHFFHD